MAFDYAEIAGTAAEILAEFGRIVTLRRTSVGAYDPVTGVNTTTTSDTARKGALFDFPASQERTQAGMILQKDKKLIMEAGVVPTIQDKVIVGSDEYTNLGLAETNPAGTPVVYTLHLRKS